MRRVILSLAILAAMPAWAADSIDDVNEGDTAKCSITFEDENGAAVNPDRATIKVTAGEDGTIVFGPVTVVSPGTTWTLTCLTRNATTRRGTIRPTAQMIRKIESAHDWGDMTKTNEWTVLVNQHTYPPPTPVATATP